MGWNEEGFSPYVGDVAFDSADSFRPIYKAIGQAGSLENWLSEALDARSYSLTARIVLAASFVSVLVEPLGCLPFFVHLWSMDSGTGKTVAQMLGSSVWANPTAGGAYFQTFKSTSVGVELMAGFLHSLPMLLDELQLAKDRHGRINFNVYELTAGSGKLRGNKSLGLDYTPKWANCFINLLFVLVWGRGREYVSRPAYSGNAFPRPLWRITGGGGLLVTFRAPLRVVLPNPFPLLCGVLAVTRPPSPVLFPSRHYSL